MGSDVRNHACSRYDSVFSGKYIVDPSNIYTLGVDRHGIGGITHLADPSPDPRATGRLTQQRVQQNLQACIENESR